MRELARLWIGDDLDTGSRANPALARASRLVPPSCCVSVIGRRCEDRHACRTATRREFNCTIGSAPGPVGRARPFREGMPNAFVGRRLPQTDHAATGTRKYPADPRRTPADGFGGAVPQAGRRAEILRQAA